MYRVMNRPYRFISRESISGKEFDFDEMCLYHKDMPDTLRNIVRLKNDIRLLSGMNPYAAVHYILYGMGYLDFIRSIAVKAGGDPKEAEEKALEIKDRARGYRSHEAFLKAVEDYTNELAVMQARNHKGGEKGDRDAVTVMTFHASKGLEFDKVYMPCANEGVIPGSGSITLEEIEEERRLFYVGMTRAKDCLMISYSREEYGNTLEPTRFLNINQGTVL